MLPGPRPREERDSSRLHLPADALNNSAGVVANDALLDCATVPLAGTASPFDPLLPMGDYQLRCKQASFSRFEARVSGRLFQCSQRHADGFSAGLFLGTDKRRYVKCDPLGCSPPNRDGSQHRAICRFQRAPQG